MPERPAITPDLLPPPCTECEPQEQRYYFRSFTEQSYHTFQQDPLRQTSCDLYDFTDMSVVNRHSVDHPGTFWSSADPLFAYSMGIARGIIEKEKIRFMALNYCSHDYQEGVRPFEVVGIASRNPKFYVIEKIHPTIDYRDEPLSGGTVFPSLSARQVDQAKWFHIPDSFIQKLSPHFAYSNPSDSEEEKKRVYRQFYSQQNPAYTHDIQLFMNDMVHESKLERQR